MVYLEVGAGAVEAARTAVEAWSDARCRCVRGWVCLWVRMHLLVKSSRDAVTHLGPQER